MIYYVAACFCTRLANRLCCTICAFDIAPLATQRHFARVQIYRKVCVHFSFALPKFKYHFACQFQNEPRLKYSHGFHVFDRSGARITSKLISKSRSLMRFLAGRRQSRLSIICVYSCVAQIDKFPPPYSKWTNHTRKPMATVIAFKLLHFD